MSKNSKKKDNRSLRDPNDRVVGTVVKDRNNQHYVESCNIRTRNIRFKVKNGNLGDAQPGDIVVLDVHPENKVASVAHILGTKDTPGILSLISAYEKNLSMEFSKAAIKETENLTVPGLEGREDLRNIPLVTIDPYNAGDYDDAVFAEKIKYGSHEKTKDGFHLIVAIADVSWYVRPGSALDEEARKRGNSTYLPGLVIPMLPKKISNEICSLRPNQDRACMAYHLWIDNDGNLTNHKLVRGLMRSVARLNYEQVQEARDGHPDDMIAPLMKDVINPLYDAYAALKKATEKRGALDLDLPEHNIILDNKRELAFINEKYALDSNRLIAEFMILANIASGIDSNSVFRIHDTPPQDGIYAQKIENLRKYLGTYGLTLPAGEITDPSVFNDVIKKASEMPNVDLSGIKNAILRVQSRAEYSTDNIGHFGHFGLELEKYGHHTSPIRRYSDLWRHRALAIIFNMAGADTKDSEQILTENLAQHISKTESKSEKAEYNAHDRYTAASLQTKIGEEFSGTITNITKAGLFLRMSNIGTDVFLPMKNLLPSDYYDIDNDRQKLIGYKHKHVYNIGAPITVRLTESDPLTGSIIVKPINNNGADISEFKIKEDTGFKFKSESIPQPA
ncbi:MAG: VacB/RNase II family 3'-5' exoribonuclease [Alphaproteobacteria bacterium]|nr:VacB/RNase II family 3'-5' exoribonuclease [Alphaproteobacteria bacterium]